MKVEARIVLEFGNDAVARAIASSLAPDNLAAPETMRIMMTRKGSKILVMIEEKSISKLAVAVNDVLISAHLAQAVLQAAA